MYSDRHTLHQGESKNYNSFQNKDILKASSTFSLQGDVINIQNLHPTLNRSNVAGSGLGDSSNNIILPNRLPAEQRTNDHKSAVVHKKVNNLNRLEPSEPTKPAYKLSKPRKIRELSVQMGLPSVRACGRHLINREGGAVLVKRATGEHGIDGLRSCGCKHCAVCMTKVAIHRENRLDTIIQNAINENYSLLFVTYTIHHTLADRIEDTKASLKKMLTGLHNSRRIKRLFKREQLPKKYRKGNQGNLFAPKRHNEVLPETTIDYTGYVIRYEDRFSEKTGYHSHAHVVYFVKGENKNISDEQKELIDNTLFTEYEVQAAKVGVKVHKKGFDSQFVNAYSQHVSGYFCKTDIDKNLTNEFTDMLNKKSAVSRSLFQLIEYWSELKESDPKKADYIKNKTFALSHAIKGKRDFVVSKHLKPFDCSPDAELTDKEIVSKKQEVKEVIGRFNAPIWEKIRRANIINYLPSVAKRGGIDAVILFLCDRGLPATYDADTLVIELLE